MRFAVWVLFAGLMVTGCAWFGHQKPATTPPVQAGSTSSVSAGASTREHYHPKAEEIYYITAGLGRIRIEGETRDVKPGDAIAIPPGRKHKLWNTGPDTLKLLCCCAPAYEHSDTIITETGG